MLCFAPLSGKAKSSMRSPFPAFVIRAARIARFALSFGATVLGARAQPEAWHDLTASSPLLRERARRAIRLEAPGSIERALDVAATIDEPRLVILLDLSRSLPSPTYVPRLDAASRHPSRRVRILVARVLGERGLLDESAARERLLGNLLGDLDVSVRSAALDALVAIDRRASATVLGEWLAKNPRERCNETIWRKYAELDAARADLLDRFLATSVEQVVVRRALGARLGSAVLIEDERGRLDALFDAVALLLASRDAGTRRAGERALLDAAFHLTRARHLDALERGTRRMIERFPTLSEPHQRLAFLLATQDVPGAALEPVLERWLAIHPDVRRPAALDAFVQADVLRGVDALRRGNAGQAADVLQRAVKRLDLALDELAPWRDPWDGGHALDARFGGAGSVGQGIATDEMEERLLAVGASVRAPERPFDATRRGYGLYRVRIQLLLAFAMALNGREVGDRGLADLLEEAYDTASIDVYRASVALRGASLLDPERFPDFGESLDLAFEGELGLYDVARSCLQGVPGPRTVDALLVVLEGLSAIGPWAAAELATPGAAAESSSTLKARELLMRYPSRFRVWLAQLILDELSDTSRAETLFAEAALGFTEQASTWPGAARLAATAHHGRGSCAIQERDGDRAVEILLGAIQELEAFQRAYERRVGPGSAAWLDPDLASMYVSVAVAQNVLLGRPEIARASMEKALALDPSDFNVVLNACYQARAGDIEAARRAIERVPRAPDLYYNLACTHALLQEHEKAIAFLELDLSTNYPTRAGRRQQELWAWGDPDLESLRDHPRFRDLCGDPPR